MNDQPRVVWLGRHLLDHQIVSADQQLLGKVDDLLLESDRDEPPAVTALLTGQIAYGQRLGGRLGNCLRDMARRLRGQSSDDPRRFDIGLVKELTHTVVLGVPDGDIPPPDLEQWLSTHLIGRFPGSGS
jgi:hypothetical protein